MMGFFGDVKTIFHFVAKPVRGKTHAERLESFYSGQAKDYDSFRKRLLHGREALWKSLPKPEGGIWVDMGGGTGSNIENLSEDIHKLKKVYIVDLSQSLLKMADQLAQQHGWDNVVTSAEDATKFSPSEGLVDVVTFSYSLTMIPDWFAALENAKRILKPGGVIGVVDFYVSRKYPGEGHKKHGWFTRSFWPVWFASDNVYPNPDHVPFLHTAFDVVHFEENKGKVPYMPLVRMPYYRFVGRKPVTSKDLQVQES
jgi:S-adenosylmethionine-diacylgycerolhomoserine-N-methlytransferase